MEKLSKQMRWQRGTLVALRIIIGWHILYEGIFKLIHPEWSALGFLANAQWIFSGIADWIISSQGILNVVDTLNTWGLMTRIAAKVTAHRVGMMVNLALGRPPLHLASLAV